MSPFKIKFYVNCILLSDIRSFVNRTERDKLRHIKTIILGIVLPQGLPLQIRYANLSVGAGEPILRIGSSSWHIYKNGTQKGTIFDITPASGRVLQLALRGELFTFSG